ncbi:hypothetical protein KP509_32G040100 [Ceratopteris richardii]|uniref:Uncharacterized protein n=1 Tax=Ceratopteris richardii TaxID=49495 RepID=A0A8T2QUM5_CERRI|nr:hypothetical protein KP509_32G040100 [Ceratopteris richardii]
MMCLSACARCKKAIFCSVYQVASSTLERFMPQKVDLPMWQNIFLLAALIINSILGARRWQQNSYFDDSTKALIVPDSTMEGRVRKLEEDIASSVTIIRGLSKHVEKLAVRFRVTRRTLRDPIQETAAVAQKTSDSVKLLTARGIALERDIREVHQVLLKMQENQAKQLELVSTLGKLVKDGRKKNPGENKYSGAEIQHGKVHMNSEHLSRNDSDELQVRTQFMETQEDTMHKKEQSDSFSSTSKSNDVSAHRTDFWLKSSSSEEHVGDSIM